MTKPGASPYTTVSPPSTACATTPSGSSTPRIARSRRNGRREKPQSPAGDRRERDEAGERAVAELDQRVAVRLGDEPAVRVAVRPARAPQPRAGDPHRRAGEDNQRQRAEREGGDSEVRAGVDLEALAHAGQRM